MGRKFLSGKKIVFEGERERTINHKEWETRRGSWLRRGINLNYVVSRRRDRDSIDRDEATDTRHVIRDHATDRARSNNFQGGSFRRKCAERRSSSLHYRASKSTSRTVINSDRAEDNLRSGRREEARHSVPLFPTVLQSVPVRIIYYDF